MNSRCVQLSTCRIRRKARGLRSTAACVETGSPMEWMSTAACARLPPSERRFWSDRRVRGQNRRAGGRQVVLLGHVPEKKATPEISHPTSSESDLRRSVSRRVGDVWLRGLVASVAGGCCFVGGRAFARGCWSCARVGVSCALVGWSCWSSFRCESSSLHELIG